METVFVISFNIYSYRSFCSFDVQFPEGTLEKKKSTKKNQAEARMSNLEETVSFGVPLELSLNMGTFCAAHLFCF